jgi:CheY-like chemotaxis protein
MVLYKNIFIADDDEDDRYLFTNALREIDETIQCEFATDGKNALTILKNVSQLPDVLFLDLNMPILNGLECLRKLKNDIRLNQLPVVIFTTSQNPEDIEITYRLGANVFFSKPSDYNEMKEKLERILNLNFLPGNPNINATFQYAV